MDGFSPERFAVKVPVVPEAVALLLAVVGPAPVDQQMPRSEMADPPSEETFPPEVAVVWAILLTAVVEETVGMVAPRVVKETCSAYPTPAELIA